MRRLAQEVIWICKHHYGEEYSSATDALKRYYIDRFKMDETFKPTEMTLLCALIIPTVVELIECYPALSFDILKYNILSGGVISPDITYEIGLYTRLTAYLEMLRVDDIDLGPEFSQGM